MKAGSPGGFQVAFFIFAAWLLVVPLSRGLAAQFSLDDTARAILDRYDAVMLAGLGLLLIPVLRHASATALRSTIPSESRPEVAAVTTLLPLHFFAWAAIYALSCHFTEGPVALEQRIASLGTNDGAMDEALRPANLAAWLVFAVLLGPIIEEVVFRAFLFRAWERRFGWFASMILTSTVFGLLHPNFIPAFVASSVYACLYRRTGSLHAPIIAHAAGNLLAMYPMLGRWVFPRDLHAPGDLQSWMPQIACLLVVLVLWPAYIWMTFEERNGDFPVEDDHVPLPR